MASQSELATSALNHALKTSWTWDKYLNEIRTNPSYAYKNTEWYKAGADLNAAKSGASGGGGNPTPPPSSVADAQARIFLAQNPLESLAAPNWMVPVCTADHGYRQFYTVDVVEQLRSHFGHVESWCDCRIASGYVEGQGTGFDEAVKMAEQYGLDGCWGQCETQMEWDNAYAAGSRRMVGKISAEVCDETRLAKVASGEVHLSVELYSNCMPWVVPDWRNANNGVGGNCVAVYADATPCYYTPISWYREKGYYVPKRDSVYGVGLTPADWAALA
jgi:hypothetical protein